MSTPKLVLAVGCLLAIFCIVGRMDYEDAVLIARANGHDAIRLICRHPSIETFVYRHSSIGTPVTSQSLIFNPDDDATSSTLQELRCVVVNK